MADSTTWPIRCHVMTPRERAEALAEQHGLTDEAVDAIEAALIACAAEEREQDQKIADDLGAVETAAEVAAKSRGDHYAASIHQERSTTAYEIATAIREGLPKP